MSNQKQSNEIDFPMPKVTIDRMVLERIRRYVGQCNTEISGFGFATHDNGKFHIMDARVVKQDAVSSAHTDINKDALNALVTGWKDLDGVLVWWHSHVNMDTFWSFQDKTTILDLGKHWMCLAMVFNKRNEQRCALSFKVNLPFINDPQVIMIDDIPVSAVLETSTETLATWDKELKDALPEPVVHTPPALGKWEDTWERGYYEGGTNSRIGLNQNLNWDPKDFWESVEEAKTDIDWNVGCYWIDSMGKWRKSWKQRQRELAESDAGKSLITSTSPVGSPSAGQDMFIQSRRQFAIEDDDIIMYHPINDQYELVNGHMVDAEWYIGQFHDRETSPALMGLGNPNLSEQELEDLYEQIKKEREQELAALEDA